MSKPKNVLMLCMVLVWAVITNCPAQNTQAPKSFKTYLELFSSLSLPIAGSKVSEDVQVPQKEKLIPIALVQKFISPAFSEKKSSYISMGRIPWTRNRIMLLVGRGSIEWGPVKCYLLVYNKKGGLLQKLLFDDRVYTRNQLYGYLSKDYQIKLKGGAFDGKNGEYIPKTYKFKINHSGKIMALDQDRWGYLENMTPVGQMIKQAKAYYGSLDKGNYSLISLYFAPKVHQWLTLKNTNGDKIATEADRFLSTKRNVYYAPLFSKVKAKGNTLILPIKLGWNNYQTNVTATITFNNRYEIISLQEKAK